MIHCWLGTASEFRTRFENPIRRGRDAGGTDKEVQEAQEKLQELNQIVNRCIIRRTQALLTKYLPVKSNINGLSSWLIFYFHYQSNKWSAVNWCLCKLIYIRNSSKRASVNWVHPMGNFLSRHCQWLPVWRNSAIIQHWSSKNAKKE